MRKKKNENLKAAHMTVSIPPSFLKAYRGRLSAVVQEAMAERIIGMSYNDLCQAYAVDARERRDPLEQELVRCARWVLEGDIIGLRLVSGEVEVDVRWQSGIVTTVAIDGETEGFRKVCYDADLGDKRTSKTAGVRTDVTLTGLAQNLSSFKMMVLKQWLRRSELLEVTELVYEDGDLCSFRVTAKAKAEA